MAFIVAVEDSEVQATIVRRALERDGHKVQVVLNSANILEILTRYRPDALITDIEMPQLNGVELIRLIRQTKDFACLPIVVFTAVGNPTIERAAWDAGCDAYLIKPMSIPEFRAFINEFLQKLT